MEILSGFPLTLIRELRTCHTPTLFTLVLSRLQQLPLLHIQDHKQPQLLAQALPTPELKTLQSAQRLTPGLKILQLLLVSMTRAS